MQNSHKLPALTITANASAGRDSFETYRQAVSSIFDAALGDWSRSPDFSIHVDCVQVGPMLLAQAGMFNADYRYERSIGKVAQVGADVLLVQIILAGSDTRLVRDRPIVSQPGDVFLCDLKRTLTTRTRNCRNFTFAIPHALLGMSDLALDDLHDCYFPASSIAAKLLNAHIATLWAERGQIDAKDAAHFAASTAGLIASLTAAAADDMDRQADITRAKVIRVQRFIEANLTTPALGPDFICAQLGLSRSALYRLLEPLGGVANYVRERRLRRVFQEITDTRYRNRKISEVAYNLGFVNAAAFSRAFKSVYGATPSDIRSMAEHAPYWLASSEEPLHDGERLRHWLHMLGRL
jgi:AraC-like DNA-binding protein